MELKWKSWNLEVCWCVSCIIAGCDLCRLVLSCQNIFLYYSLNDLLMSLALIRVDSHIVSVAVTPWSFFVVYILRLLRRLFSLLPCVTYFKILSQKSMLCLSVFLISKNYPLVMLDVKLTVSK